MASISDIVSVNATIDTGGVSERNFGITLFVTTDTTLKAETLKLYDNLEAVAVDFSTTSEPYIAAEIYFAQEPTPRSFMVGRWFKNASPAALISGVLPPLTTIQAITNGGLTINSVSVDGVNFSAATSYADAANILQLDLVAAGIASTVVFDSVSAKFVIETTATGSAATLTYATAPSGGSTDDLSVTLLLNSSLATSLSQGMDAETIDQAMDRFVSISNLFYFITLEVQEKDTQTVIDLSTWVVGKTYLYFAESSDTQALITDETGSIFAQLFAQGSDRTAGDWTPLTPSVSSLFTKYLSVSSAARLSSVDFSAENSVINPAFKQRPLIQASTLNSTQITELNRKRVNYYVPVGGDTVSPTVVDIYQNGTAFKVGIWQDIRFGVDWLVNAITVSVFNALLEYNVIAQTVESQAIIKAIIEQQCQQGVRNGLLAAGSVSETTKAQIISITGNTKFNGTLSAAYLVYPVPLSNLSEADRIARKLTPFYVWCTGSGAVNFIDINLFFEQ